MPSYSCSSAPDSSELKFINGAMREFERHTCVRFRRRRPEDVAYVSIDNIEPGCWSDVGRGVERTVVNLQPGCANALTTPVHELMHTLGFYHEHNRLDRDRYVTILYENMLPDECEWPVFWFYCRFKSTASLSRSQHCGATLIWSIQGTQPPSMCRTISAALCTTGRMRFRNDPAS